jgi:hypothetical protein
MALAAKAKSMDDSGSQFQELIANAMVYSKRMLAREQRVLPFSLLLKRDGEIEAAVGLCDTPELATDVVSAMETSLIGCASELSALATCIVLPVGTGEVVMFLENHENYCLTVRMPLAADSSSLDSDRMVIEDGSIRVFPVVN